MRKNLKKLQLNRETVRGLDNDHLARAGGGLKPPPTTDPGYSDYCTFNTPSCNICGTLASCDVFACP
jgi:hypothetical protein